MNAYPGDCEFFFSSQFLFASKKFSKKREKTEQIEEWTKFK